MYIVGFIYEIFVYIDRYHRVHSAWLQWRNYTLHTHLQLQQSTGMMDSNSTANNNSSSEQVLEYKQLLQTEKQKCVIANARYTSVIKQKCQLESDMSALRHQLESVQTELYTYKGISDSTAENITNTAVVHAYIKQQPLTHEQLQLIQTHHACVLDTIHPMITKVQNDQDLFSVFIQNINKQIPVISINNSKGVYNGVRQSQVYLFIYI